MRFPDWDGLLPDNVALDLLARWNERRRHYHGISHLVNGLQTLQELGGTELEQIAFWFHDAVHSNATPADERASADLAGAMLSGVLPVHDVSEVQRLIMLTTHHQPVSEDIGGARLCDADLSAMGADWDTYVDNIAGIRLEFPHLNDKAWRKGRSKFVVKFLDRRWLFSTWEGRHRWEDQARANMVRELACLS